MDVQVIGVTVDRPETHRRWAARNDVRLPMIDDTDCRVAKAFDVAQRFGGVKHTTVLIDPLGTLCRVYPKVKAKGHAAIVLQDCRRIWG